MALTVAAVLADKLGMSCAYLAAMYDVQHFAGAYVDVLPLVQELLVTQQLSCSLDGAFLAPLL